MATVNGFYTQGLYKVPGPVFMCMLNLTLVSVGLLTAVKLSKRVRVCRSKRGKVIQ